MFKKISLLFVALGLFACQGAKAIEINKLPKSDMEKLEKPILDIQQAQKIWELPVSCITQEYPNKLGQTLGSDEDLKAPRDLRPIFYGCFDWHSAVHGYWSIVKLMKTFPELDADGKVRATLNQHITSENVAIELAFFQDENNLNFERTYGWAWLFTLQKELLDWKSDADAQSWAGHLQVLNDALVEKYKAYLPKLTFPIRTGTHDNTAFGLSHAIDYARYTGDKDFEDLIITHAKRLYENDMNCPIQFEPSGHDFLSPCLEEALLMSKVYNQTEFKTWMSKFLPNLMNGNLDLKAAEVSDRSDGHLVHLDGLNFSRATCLFGIAKALDNDKLNASLSHLATQHFNHAIDNISDDHYMGSHWLGSFALYALQTAE